MDMAAIICAVISGLVSSVATIAVIKTDISWMKKVLEKHDQVLGEHSKQLAHCQLHQ